MLDENERLTDEISVRIQRKSEVPPRTLLGWLVRVLQGAIIGTGAILPGISGGGAVRDIRHLSAHDGASRTSFQGF